MSDACLRTPSRRIPSISTASLFLPAPHLPNGLDRPSSLCTGAVGGSRPRRRPIPDAELLAHLLLDGSRDVLVVAQEVARVLASLSDAIAVERVPGARLLDDAVLGREVDELALFRDAGAVEDVELRLAKRRRDLVL